MKNILLIIRREFLTRVRKLSFWLLALLVPLVVALLYLLPPLLASHPGRQAHVLVVDETGLFANQMQNSASVAYQPAGGLDYAQRCMREADSIDAVLYIPSPSHTIPNEAFLYYFSHAPSASLQNDIDHELQVLLRNSILLDVYGISSDDYKLVSSTRIRLHANDLATGHEAYLGVKSAMSVLLSVLSVLVVLLFGSQVLRSVLEERTNRVVEILLSSVHPFQLMMGKVVGVGLVGLLQFAVWIALSALAVVGIRHTYSDLFAQVEALSPDQIATKGTDAVAQMQSLQPRMPFSDLLGGLSSIDFATVVPLFVLVAMLGYLLYAALFASVGAWSSRDTDGTAFALPLVSPLLFALACLPAMLAQPSGLLAVTLSFIPFTAPVALLCRLPFGLPVVQTVLSIVLMVVAIPLCTLVSAIIYRRRVMSN